MRKVRHHDLAGAAVRSRRRMRPAIAGHQVSKLAVSQDLSRIFDKTQDRSPILQNLRRIDCDLAFFSSEIWRSFHLRFGLTGMFN
eukprot:scaffold10897_cov102-Isochrysis_galbana.AAC.2